MLRHNPETVLESVSLKLTCASTSSIAGKRIKLTIPLNGLVLDKQGAGLGEQPAYLSALLPLQLGNGTTAAPSGVDIVAQQVKMTGNDANDPRQAVVAQVTAVIEVDSEADAFSSIPLVIQGLFRSAGSPRAFAFPAFSGDSSPAITAKDASGNSVPVKIVEFDPPSAA